MNDYSDLLDNYSYFSALLDNRYDRNNVDILKLEQLESFIIKNRKNKEYIDIIKQYASFIYRKFKENPYIIFDSRILRYTAFEHFFDRNQILEINRFKRMMDLSYTNLLRTVKKGDKIDERYLRYAISMIGLDHNLTKRTYKFLLNNYRHDYSYFVEEFLVKYTAYLAGKELGISYDNVYYTDYDFVSDKILESNKCSGLYDSKMGYIFINKERKYDLLELIQSTCHEMKHRKQHVSVINGIINPYSFYWLLQDIFFDYTKEHPYNYYSRENELDANDYGWDLSYRIFSTYTDDKWTTEKAMRNRNSILFEKAINFKYGKDETIVLESNKYNISLLDDIVKKNPGLVIKHPLLAYIYDIAGNRDSFYSLVFKEQALIKKDKVKYRKAKEVFREFYIYDISNGVDIDVEGLSSENQNILINKLLDLAIQEIEDILNIIGLSHLNRGACQDRTNRKIKIRIKRVMRILDMLNKNKSFINKIHSDLIETKIEKLLSLIGRMKIDLNNDFLSKLFFAKNTRAIQYSGYKLKKAIK